MAGKITVVVRSGSDLMRSGIVSLLQSDENVEIMREKFSYFESLSSRGGPMVAVLEDDLSQRKVLEHLFARRRTSTRLDIATLLLTNTTRASRIIELMHRGVRGMLPLDCTGDEVSMAVRAVSSGGCYLHDYFLSPIYAMLDRAFMAAGDLDLLGVLTTREREVLDLIAGGNSNDDIAASLSLSNRTVKYHVSNILGKLRARNRWEAVTLAYGVPLALGETG